MESNIGEDMAERQHDKYDKDVVIALGTARLEDASTRERF